MHNCRVGKNFGLEKICVEKFCDSNLREIFPGQIKDFPEFFPRHFDDICTFFRDHAPKKAQFACQFFFFAKYFRAILRIFPNFFQPEFCRRKFCLGQSFSPPGAQILSGHAEFFVKNSMFFSPSKFSRPLRGFFYFRKWKCCFG